MSIYFIHRNLTQHRLVIIDFNVLTSNKIKTPLELSSRDIPVLTPNSPKNKSGG